MKTVWLLSDPDDPYTVGIDLKGVFATEEAAIAWRETVAESQRVRARADGWIDDSPNALRWDISEYEVNQ